MNAPKHKESIEAMSQAIISILDLESPPLDVERQRESQENCITRISSMDSEYGETWKKIRYSLNSHMDSITNRTQYLTLSGDQEWVEVLARHPGMFPTSDLLLRYHIDGRISIRSTTKIYISEEYIWDTSREVDFICVEDHLDLEAKDVHAREDEVIGRVESLIG